MSNSPLQGRIFDRFRAFEKLSQEIQTQVGAVVDYLLKPENKTGALGLKEGGSVNSKKPHSVDGAQLLSAITKHLEEAKAEDTSADAVKKLAEGLVLRGFVSPLKETSALEGFGFDSEKFVVVDPAASPSLATSVWSLKDGAIQAGELKRKKTGLLSKFTGSTGSVYVVANDKSKTVGVFASDIAQQAITTLDISSGSVQFDSSIANGIRLSNGKVNEIFGAPSKEKQDEWLNSFINAGATYREAFNLTAESVKSFYELKDYDMQGKEVSMADYKGKVVMVVNVSSLCGLTPTNYPELTALDEKYRDQGLAILAFPCNQFASQEPGTHEEIMEFVKQYNCQFPFFEKRDVNGANARPVFTYLKAKLPGAFGNFVKWNFTKFLVDRNGVPFKRYAPKDLPFSFEEDIKTLLAQEASAEDTTEKKEEVKVEEKKEEAKAEEPKPEEPKVEEPKVEEPKSEEPKVEEKEAAATAAATEAEKKEEVAEQKAESTEEKKE
ncbi:hypothetical protein Poli38472_010330 [Pythium oligandrum]|uniref:Glutathione peroxidase n=1 Tax=Pythium oligandrum TaxID=41045 RepID=A0A8K1C313_PYTOL|nr:hypothetical protein Poli38472_010330 [Pythium oligandrum]|eukprot:TMW55448.1 hypothetical protein Poli38472_010330 [Pythium oligandrum]